MFQKILQPVAHLPQFPGKEIRARFSHAYNYWLKVPPDKLMIVKGIADMFHHSILLLVQVLPFFEADIQFVIFLKLSLPISTHTPCFKISWKLV
jgi:hypothetical protein